MMKISRFLNGNNLRSYVRAFLIWHSKCAISARHYAALNLTLIL